MPNAVFPRWQGGFLVLFLLAEGLYLPATPAAVWSLIWGALLAALAAWLWLRLLKATGARDFFALCQNHLPRAGQYALFAAVGLAAIAAILQSLVRLSAFWRETAFPAMPQWVSAAVLLAVGVCAGRRGRMAVAMWSYPTAFVIALTVAASLVVTLSDCLPVHLLETAAGIAPPQMLSLRFVPLVLPLLLCEQDRHLSATHACVRGVLLGGLGLVLLSLRAYLVLGAGAAALPYPAFSAAGVFSVGDFLQRGEVVFGCALALCEAVRVALLAALLGELCGCLRRSRGALPRTPQTF